MNAFKYVIYESLVNNLKISADINFRANALDPNGQKYFYNVIKNNKEEFVTAKPKSCLTISYYDKDVFPEPSIFIGQRDIRNLKACLAQVLQNAYAADLFTDINGEQVINMKYSDNIIFRTSSAKDNWIRFQLCLSNDNQLGVIVELSKAEGRCSAMPISELETIYDTLCDFNLLTFSFIMTAAELNSQNQKYTFRQPQEAQRGHQFNGNQPQFNPYNNGNAPFYGNQQPVQQNFRNQAPAVAPQRSNNYQQQPVQQNFRNQPTQTAQYVKPAAQVIQPRPQTNQAPLYQPKENNSFQQSTQQAVTKSRMEMMEETSIDEFNLDDSAALADMLGNLGND